MFKQKFTIKTLNTILIDQDNSELLSKDDKFILLGVMRDNGYVLSHENVKKFIDLDITVNTSREVLAAINEIRGGAVEHKVLFGVFPKQDPNTLKRSLVAFINHLSGYFESVPDMLRDDSALYALSEVGHKQYLTLCDKETFEQEVKTLFETKIPLSLDHESFISSLYASNDDIIKQIDSNNIVLKEILARHIAWELNNSIEKLSARNAIDVLRAVAILSGEPNATLNNSFKIKSLKNSQRKKIIETLNNIANIDDVASKKEMFKKLFKILHVHESKYSNFENIRKLAKEVQTVNNPKTTRTVLHKLIEGYGSEEAFDIILNNPSLFIRNLDALLRKHDTESVLGLFELSLKKRDVETKLLVQILDHFYNRNKDVQTRLFKPKGKSTPVAIDKPLDALSQEVIDQLEKIIKDELRRQYKSKPDTYFDKVKIHPDLYKINIPKDVKTQDGIKVVSRGSRVKMLGDGNILRMFVHWKDYCDIDLSAALHYEDYKRTNQTINFSYLSGDFWEHSGDVRSAPLGGSEFIDIYLDKLPKEVHYISMVLNCYSGESYENVNELFAGYMLREDKYAGKIFEPSTVQEKYSIGTGRDFKVKMLFDVKNREVIMIDSSGGSGQGSTINSVDFTEMFLQILDRKYVTVGDLIELHSDYVLCEDEEKVMSEDDLNGVKFFDEKYGFNVLDITAKLL